MRVPAVRSGSSETRLHPVDGPPVAGPGQHGGEPLPHALQHGTRGPILLVVWLDDAGERQVEPVVGLPATQPAQAEHRHAARQRGESRGGQRRPLGQGEAARHDRVGQVGQLLGRRLERVAAQQVPPADAEQFAIPERREGVTRRPGIGSPRQQVVGVRRQVGGVRRRPIDLPDQPVKVLRAGDQQLAEPGRRAGRADQDVEGAGVVAQVAQEGRAGHARPGVVREHLDGQVRVRRLAERIEQQLGETGHGLPRGEVRGEALEAPVGDFRIAEPSCLQEPARLLLGQLGGEEEIGGRDRHRAARAQTVSLSPVRMLNECSTGITKIRPSPISPVRVAVMIASTTASTSSSRTTTSTSVFGRRLTLVLLAAVGRGVALLPAVAAHFGHGHPGQAQRVEGLLDVVHLVGAHDRLNELHNPPPECARDRHGAPVERTSAAWPPTW